MIEVMYAPWMRGGTSVKSTQAGASVLAALVLVAILGGVLLVFQYVRSSGDFSYEPGALVASLGAQATQTATPATAPAPANNSSIKAPEAKGCTVIKDGPNAGKTTCPCSQTEASPTLAGDTAGKAGVEQCLPGCSYKLTPGNPPIIKTLNSASMSDPSKSECRVTVCGADSTKCSGLYYSGIGKSLSYFTPSITAAGIALAPDSETVAQITSAYSSNRGDLNALSDSLNSTSNEEEFTQVNETIGGGLTPSSAAAQDNIDAANDKILALENPTTEPPSVCTDGSTGNCTNHEPPLTTTNPDLSKNVTGLDATNGGCAASMQPNGSGGCVPNSGDAANGGCTSGMQPNGSGGCVPSSVTPAGTFQGPCPAGQVQTSTGCGSAPEAAPAPAPAPAPKTGFKMPDLGSIASIGISALTGFLHGFSSASAQQQAQQAMQAAQAARQQAAAPYGTGTDGYACPPPQPQPSYSQCTIGTWQQTYQSNRCPSTWQCVPSNANPGSTATQPSANISCQPQTADVGMSISISYSCTNATGSTGGGFSTENQLSGSATTVINPPAGAITANYGVTCINQSQTQSLTASAQCAVQINQPSIVLVANPSVVATSSTTAIGWVTSGMNACTISSPDSAAFTAANAGNTSVNGVAITQPLSAPLRVVLTCTTIGGSTKIAQTTVTIGGTATLANNAPLTITSSMDNASVAHGGVITLNWSSISPPAGSAVSLWLVNKQTNATNAVIAGGLGVNGVYSWHIPAVGASCNPNASNVCASDLTQGGTYAIEAVMYTPTNAYIGDGTAPSNPITPVYGQSAVTGTFTLNDNAMH